MKKMSATGNASKIQKVSGAKKPKKLAVDLTIYIIIGLTVVFAILIFSIQNIIRNDLIIREQDKLAMIAKENASVARDLMETALSKQQVIVYTAKSLDGVEETQKVNTLKKIISDTKISQKDTLSLFIVAEPNTIFADTPNGFSIFSTDKGTVTGNDMYELINKELYEKIKATNKMAIVDPFMKTIDGKEYMVVTALQPILNAQGNTIGIVGSNIDTAVLNGADYNDGGFKSFTNQIICGHQTIIIHNTHPEWIGKKFIDASESTNTQMILDSAKDASVLDFLDTNIDGQKYYKSYSPFYITGSDVVWLSGTSITKAEFDETIIKQITSIVIISIVGLVALAIIAFIRINKQLKPIQEIERAAQELAKGNLQVEVKYHSNDELGSLADSLRESISSIYGYVYDIDGAMGEMAKGNFDVTPAKPFIGDFKNIERSMTKFITDMSSSIKQMDEVANGVSGGAIQVTDSAQMLAQGAAEQASAVEELAATIDDVSVQIRSNAKNAEEASTKVKSVGAEITDSNRQMEELINAMREISKSSNEIGKVIKTIEDIAFQTNILALNAAVEAARAGQAGKGFAVVADEVRNLATKSSEAAKGSNSLIESSIKAVSNGTKIADETAKSLLNVVDGAMAISEKVDKIATASSIQAEAIEQITRGIDQISDVIQTSSATTEECAASSEELSGQSQILKGLLARFKIKGGSDSSNSDIEPTRNKVHL